jgi:hypothetical protein
VITPPLIRAAAPLLAGARWRSRGMWSMVFAMKLADKGRYAPPPQLEPAAQGVAETVARWPGVQARAHWLLGDERRTDGADFYLVE